MNIEIDIPDSLANDLLRGAPAISKFIDEPVPRVCYLAEKRILPIGRLGSTLIASKRELRAFYERLTKGAEQQSQPRPTPMRGQAELRPSKRPRR
jgi:hypothetical protein